MGSVHVLRYQPQRDEAREIIEDEVVKRFGPPETQAAKDRLVAMSEAAASIIVADRIKVIEAAVRVARDLGHPDVAHTIESSIGAGL